MSSYRWFISYARQDGFGWQVIETSYKTMTLKRLEDLVEKMSERKGEPISPIAYQLMGRESPSQKPRKTIAMRYP